jgi:2-(1,2-epoxy-1,2-dihydrophenyl)acetyl-CoA isomerase
MNRPRAYNSLNIELKEALLQELQAVAKDDSIRALVLTGAGDAFCTGQDLKEHGALLASGSDSPLKTVADHYNPIVTALYTLDKPTIAAVNGVAAGAGAALAFACDLRVSSDEASFLMAFANAGLSADTGVSYTLPRLIGYGRALQLMLLAEPISADVALELGAVNWVQPKDKALDFALALGERLAQGPTLSYAEIKRAMRASADGTFQEALKAEEYGQLALGATADHAEAVRAFAEKRKPSFLGR